MVVVIGTAIVSLDFFFAAFIGPNAESKISHLAPALVPDMFPDDLLMGLRDLIAQKGKNSGDSMPPL